MTSSDRAPEVGTLIDGRYRLVRTLARGGMGWLMEADHLMMKRRVAIKLLRAERKQSARGRLLREARAMQSLSSEHVVRVFDLGVHEDDPYIAMELLHGADLAELLERDGPLTVERAVDCVLEACVAVAEAHNLGIVHRDIKPANLFLTNTPSGELVKVLDFGISKLIEPDDQEDLDATADNALLGTPHYMPPEQLRNPTNIDHRADVWALGVTLFHLVTGELPFRGATSREITAAIFTEPPRTLREVLPSAPIEIEQAIGGALAKRPKERTADVRAFALQLIAFASSRGTRAAERIADLSTSTPAAAAQPRSSQPPAAMTTTEEGLVSNVPSSTPAPPLPKRRPSPSPMRHIGLVAVFGLFVAAAAWWGSSDELQPDTAATATVRAPKVQGEAQQRSVGEVRPPAPTTPASAELPSEASAVPVADPGVLPSSAVAVQPTRSLPSNKPVPPPSPPTVVAEPFAQPGGALDIDGVPIIE